MKEQYKSDLEKNFKNQTSSENHQNSKKIHFRYKDEGRRNTKANKHNR